MHPLTIASNNLVEDVVSPAALKQNRDPMMCKASKYIQPMRSRNGKIKLS